MQQELPPTDGFGPIVFKRNLPSRGPPGWVLITGVSSIVIGGLILHAKGERIKR